MRVKNDNLWLAVAFSLLLHVVLIGLLVLGAFLSKVAVPVSGGQGSGIEAVMVDTAQVSEAYIKQLSRVLNESTTNPEQNVTEPSKTSVESVRAVTTSTDVKHSIQQSKTVESQQRQEDLLKQQELQRQEQMRQQAESALKAQEAARLQAEQAEEMKKAKAKAEREAKAKAEQEAKAKAEREAKAKAEREAKAKAEQEAKAKAEQAQRSQTLDDFLSGGTLSRGSGSGVQQGAGNHAEGDAYGQRIKRLIQSKYRVEPSFAGKRCEVRMNLSRDGTINNYQVLKGDKQVCDAAVSAIVATRKVPPAPSDAVYQRYRSPILEFGLRVN